MEPAASGNLAIIKNPENQSEEKLNKIRAGAEIRASRIEGI